MPHQVAEYLVHDYLLTINCSPSAAEEELEGVKHVSSSSIF